MATTAILKNAKIQKLQYLCKGVTIATKFGVVTHFDTIDAPTIKF